MRLLLIVSLVFLGCDGSSAKPDASSGGAGGGDAAPVDMGASDRGAGGSGGASDAGAGGGGASDAGDGPGGVGGIDAGADAASDAGVDTFSGVGCPPAFPSAGTCAPPGVLCTYGNAPRPECRDRASCGGGQWTLSPSSCTTTTVGCPATAPASSGTVGCPGAMVGLSCVYPDQGNGVECRCVGDPSTGGTLVCNRPVAPPPPCPAKLPNAGAPCDAVTLQGVSCLYCKAGALYASGEYATCGADGTWSWTPTQMTCPPPSPDGGP